MLLNPFGEAIPSEQGSHLRFDSLSGLRPDLFVFDAFGVGSLEFVQSLCPMVPTLSCP
jgi:hypothetical protein